jgi:acetyl-CoA carboxylase biotin carboxyl carrier protein
VANISKEPSKSGSEKQQSDEGDKVNKKFTLDEISLLLKMLSDNEITDFKLERGEEKISLKRGGAQSGGENTGYVQTQAMMPEYQYAPAQVIRFPNAEAPGHVQAIASPQVSVDSGIATRAEEKAVVVPTRTDLVEIKSPMVGTFYCRSAPDADPYVSIGDQVKEGDVVCIVEAMKLMNEIESTVSGKVIEICLGDGQMVEYGEVLYRIDPKA